VYQTQLGYGQLQGQPSFNPYTKDVPPPYQGCPPYAGMQRPMAQAIPSYPRYAHLDLNRQLPFLATLELPNLNWLTNEPILYAHCSR